MWRGLAFDRIPPSSEEAGEAARGAGEARRERLGIPGAPSAAGWRAAPRRVPSPSMSTPPGVGGEGDEQGRVQFGQTTLRHLPHTQNWP